MGEVTAIAIALCVACASACSIGAPPGFSSGDLWTFPLVDPLAVDRVVTPVYVHGHGPYLFAIDPLAPTLVDAEIFDAAGVVASGYRMDQHSDLADVRIGNLTISSIPFVGVAPHRLDVGGRRIYGVLGKALVASSLVYGIDRDRGIAYLVTPRAFHARPDARVISYGLGTHGKNGSPPELLVSATIDGTHRTLQIELGMAESRLRASEWRGGAASSVDVDGIEQHGISFTSRPDPSPSDASDSIDGTLGLGFFEPFSIDLDRDHHLLYLAPRIGQRAARAQRLARWGPALYTCRNPGCVTLGLQGEDLYVTPEDPRRNVEVIAHAFAPSGDPLPALGIELPQGASSFAVGLGPSYRDATIEVVDVVSPFPLPCEKAHGCVIPLQTPKE